MNLLLLAPSDFTAPNRAVLSDARANHIRGVLGSQRGDSLRVGMLNGMMGLARINALTPDRVELEVATLDAPPPPKLPLLLIMALPRPKMLRRVLRTVAEMGVPELVLLNSWKVEKSYWQTPELTSARIAQHLQEGLSQARDTVVPKLRIAQRFKPFVEDELPELLPGRLALLADAGAGQTCPVALNAACALAIGPEGGFTPYETQKFIEAGFQAASLGDRILRVDTVLPTLLGRLFTGNPLV